MTGLALLLACYLLGIAGNTLLHIPLPGNVLGMLLLLGALFAGWVKLSWFENTARFLLRHMMLFFAPTIVGTLLYIDRFGKEWPLIVLSIIGVIALVLLVTAWVTELIGGKEESS
jgi:holin-like protein